MEVFLKFTPNTVDSHVAKGFLVSRDSKNKKRCVHRNWPIVPTLGRRSCVARATAIRISCKVSEVTPRSRRNKNLGTRLAFTAGKSNSVEIAYISYKNLRYTFDKSAEKLMEEYWFQAPMLRLAISWASLNIFF